MHKNYPYINRLLLHSFLFQVSFSFSPNGALRKGFSGALSERRTDTAIQGSVKYNH